MKHKFNPFPNITTDRLFLQKTNKNDIDTFHHLRSDKLVNKYIQRPVPTLEESVAFMGKIAKFIEDGETIEWAITMKTASEMIGSICLWNISKDLTTAEIGYSLCQDQHNKGIMTEAIKAVLDFGFNTLHFDKIEAFTHRENEASKTFLFKNGFTLNPEREDKGFPHNIIFEIGNDGTFEEKR